MDELQKEWLAELERQNKKTILVRELGTRYWDKDGNPVGSSKAKTVVPEDGTLNKLSVKGYTKKHKSRPITPIFYSHDDIIRMVKDEFGTQVRKTHIPPIISNPDYILAPKGQPPIGRSDNISFLTSRGYFEDELSGKSDAEIRNLGNQERGEARRAKGYIKPRGPNNFVTINQLPLWTQAVMRERSSGSGFRGRGYETPKLSVAERAELRGTALFPGVFSYRWADPFQLDHNISGMEGGLHVPEQFGETQFTAKLKSEHSDKTAEENRRRGARRKGLNVKGLPWLMALPAGVAASVLWPGQEATASERFKDTMTDRHFWSDVVTGLDSKKFEEDYKSSYEKATGQSLKGRFDESADWWKKKLRNIWD